MAKKQTIYYKGKYYQGSLKDSEAETILNLIENYSCVSSLKNVITNVPDYLIEDIKRSADKYEKENGSLEGYELPNQGDYGVGTLEDAQTVGVAFMYYAKSALLGDEVGLGKTVQVAGLVNLLTKKYKAEGKQFRYLFLTEKVLTGQTRDKLIKFTGTYVGELESGEKGVVDNYISKNRDKRYYSVVGSHSLLDSAEFITDFAKRPFDLVVVDESSILKNSTTQLYKNAKSLFKLTNRIILLNATPLETSIDDLYNQLSLLDPKYMPTKTEFHKTFCKFTRTTFGFKINGFKNEEKFREAVSLRYIARTRAMLGAEYKDNRYKMLIVPLSPEQKELVKKTTLKQMTYDYPSGVDKYVPYNSKTAPKLGVLLELLDEFVGQRGKNVLVYCKYIEAQREIKEFVEDLGFSCVTLNGTRENSKSKVRKEKVDGFNSGVYDVLVTNVQKGLDLNSCDVCIMYSIEHNPQTMVQFEGRITREFNVEGKNIIMLVAMGSEKNYVDKVLKGRVETTQAFTKTGNSMVLQAITSGENREEYRDNMDSVKGV